MWNAVSVLRTGPVKLLTAAILSALCCSSAALAAEPSDITVNGLYVSPAEQRQAITRFVKRMEVTNETGQAARRDTPYCPAVVGLRDEYVGVILRHLREAAAATRRITEAPAGCSPNLAVIFTANGQAVARNIGSRQPQWFDDANVMMRDAFLRSDRPVRWAYSTMLSTSDGVPAMEAIARHYQSSLVSTQVKLDLTGTLVIIDVNKAEGFPLDAIASYAAMVSFAPVAHNDSLMAATPSVLGMFARSGPRIAAEQSLSDWDRAYLEAVYAMPIDRPWWQQRSALIARMNAALTAAREAGSGAAPEGRPAPASDRPGGAS
jgi:hypothetical protein